MMNLFSPFNPMTTPGLSLNWIMIIIMPTICILSIWKISGVSLNMSKLLKFKISSQFKSSPSSINQTNLSCITSILLMILYYNIYSLIPSTFSITSHMMINLSLSATLWMASTLKKSSFKKKMLSNLTPSHTPYLLIPFMVLIELTSIFIQPLTLSIRLTANVMAGHIMLILISNLYSISILPTFVLNIMMTTLELAVSFIQAYVFALLISMYSK